MWYRGFGWLYLLKYLFFRGSITLVGLGFETILGHTIDGSTPLDEWSALRRDIYLTAHNRQTSMPPAGFEPTIPVSERPQTYPLDRAATGIGSGRNTRLQYISNSAINLLNNWITVSRCNQKFEWIMNLAFWNVTPFSQVEFRLHPTEYTVSTVT